MATSTTILGLTKPSVNDAADIGVLNSNFDKIDTKCNPALFAPSGYGLGGSGKLLTSAENLDDITANGSYWWYDSRPTGALYNYCYMRVDSGEKSSKEYVTQTIWRSGGSGTIVRYNKSGEWVEEWDNPPMVLGVEYRTTERHDRRAVYVQAVSFGALPNAGEKLVSYSSKYGNVGGVLCVYGYTSGGITLPYISSYANYRLYASTTAVGIETDADKSSQTAIVIVKYCLA